MNERMKLAVMKAEDAFWASIAESYPEAKSGDLDPMMTSMIENSMMEAVNAWVEENVPPPESVKTERHVSGRLNSAK